MVRLIDDLLDVGRISGGFLELKKERIDLLAAIRTAIETCRPFLENRQQSVSVEADETYVSFADPTRIAQIIGNLVHNAGKFSAENAQIRIGLTCEDGVATIRVIDSGVGISAQQLPRVFDMFVKGDAPAGSSSGLGIGLALSRRLAELHGGSLSVASAGLGQGSVFSLSIPAEPVALPVADSVRPPPQQPPRAVVNVVVIEDNRDSAEVLTLWLRSRGDSVHFAHTGIDGLELIKKVRPQVVLCDIGLPGMDGIEICRRVRATLPEPQPVMVALTGWGMEEDRRRTKQTGFDHHLVKPVVPETLFELLDKVGLSTRTSQG
jgi:CheY-like chemotaxis protein